jgi:hypothetical protein
MSSTSPRRAGRTRISDSLFSHVWLNNAGYRPNPGLASVPLYLAETLVLAVVFYPTMLTHPFAMLIGFVIGALAFYTVIPGLRIFGRLAFPTIEPWQKGTPQPKWRGREGGLHLGGGDVRLPPLSSHDTTGSTSMS